MLPKSQRLSKNQIAWLLRKGQRFENETFRIKYLTNRQKTDRFAIIISGKTVKLATARNKLRRQIYAQLEKLTPRPHPLDLTLQVKSPLLANKTSQELEQLIHHTFVKLNYTK